MAKNSIKLGVVGLGNIALQHINNILNEHVQNAKLTATCSRAANACSKEFGVEHFNDYKLLIDSGKIDAVVIATPSMTHFEIAKYALQNNIHVMLEKPIGLSSYEGEVLLDCQNANTKFGLMLNQRTDPTFVKMKQIVESGALGKIQRTQWTMTNWFRPEIYFQVSDWRATWKGEGGGLLVNQAIHNLDVFQWICGMPSQVRAFCEFGKYHDIEVEDEVTAYFRYSNGATGSFVGSTGEAPGVNRFDIIGDKGSLYFNAGNLTLIENNQSSTQFNKQTDDMFGMPETKTTELSGSHVVNQHAVIMNNFIRSILDNEPLIANAEDGLCSLDIANAMLMSTWQNNDITMPINRGKYQQLLNKKIAESKLRDKSSREAKIDMSASYR